jgi:2-deoxy-D-gluconate 3-dehydrogenase
MDMFNLDNKTAVVTGANTGLGQAIAIGLAGAGASVIAVGRSSCAETVDAISDAGGACHEIRADLATTQPIQSIIDETVKTFGGLDILVNNAGIIRREDSIEFSEKDWDDVLNVNLKVAFFLAQAAARVMIKNGGGKIINVASMLSFQGGIRVPSYTASKSGLMGITKTLANEWAAHNINVNAIAPGYMATNNTTALRDDETRSREILGRIPAGKWGKPEDLSGAAIFLASAASDYVHGTTLTVDGGWLAR